MENSTATSDSATPPRVLICGSRQYPDAQAVNTFVSLLPEGTIVIHGDSAGADRMAGAAATLRGLPVETYPADWKGLGRTAGMVRNQEMLDRAKPTHVVCFHVLPISPGSADMIRRARLAGLPVLRIPHV